MAGSRGDNVEDIADILLKDGELVAKQSLHSVSLAFVRWQRLNSVSFLFGRWQRLYSVSFVFGRWQRLYSVSLVFARWQRLSVIGWGGLSGDMTTFT